MNRPAAPPATPAAEPPPTVPPVSPPVPSPGTGPVINPATDLPPGNPGPPGEPTNVAGGVPHFCRITPDGEGGHTEECGGCHGPWPCEDGRQLRLELGQPQPTPADVIATAVASQLPWYVVADSMGVDRQAVERWVDQHPDATA